METDRKVPGPGEDKQGWMMFAHSGPLDLRALRPGDIHLGDIIHALGRINRFLGQTRQPISVLWHSLVVTELCRCESSETRLEALLHDAAEAYVGDWINPLYGMVDDRIEGLKERIQETVFAAGGLEDRSALLSKPVQETDRLMARYESETLCGYGRVLPWHKALSGVERERVETAINGIGQPSGEHREQELAHWRFLRKAEELLPDDAPLRNTIEEAQRVYRKTSTRVTA